MTTPRISNPTKATIAARLNLSRATVTSVLNGRGSLDRISAETQRRVLEDAREIGYRTNVSARATRTGRFGNVAFIQSVLGQYLPSELMDGLAAAVADKDMHLVLTQVTDVVIDDESYLPHTLRELSADGVLINRHVGFSPSLLDRIHKLRIPAIFLNVQQEYDCIHPDDVMGGRIATEFLLGLGHERIAFVDTVETEDDHYSNAARREGYAQAMTAAGRAPWLFFIPTEWAVEGQPGADRRVEEAKVLLDRADRPTAVVAYELAESMAIVRAASLLGLRIPQDLSIIHFHHRIDERFFVPFHTVSNAMEAVGTGAIRMLVEKMKNPEVPLPERTVPEFLLEGGVTCMPPRFGAK